MLELHSLLRAAAHPLAIARDGRIALANEAAHAMLGADPVGGLLAELVLPAGVTLREAQLDERTIVCSFVRTDVRLEELLEGLDAEEASRLLLSQRHDPVSITDLATKLFFDVNDAWCAQYGYTREEAVGKMGPADVSVQPDVTSAALADSASTKAIGAPALRWHRRRDGTVFPVEVQCGSLRIRGRDLVYARLLDIEERVRAEEAMRRSEENYRTLIEHLPHAVFVHRDARILYVNSAARRLLGFAPDHVVEGTPLFELVHPDDRSLVAGRVHDQLYRGEPAPAVEERLIRRDGGIVPVEVIGIPTLFDGAPAGLAIAQDISARKEMEAQLVTSDRLASLGRLAASIGHEINNPLMYVLGSLELLRKELADAGLSPLIERVDAAEQGALRVRDVVRDLRSLTRSPAEDDQSPADLAHTLDACVQMAHHELRHRARVVREYPKTPVWVRGSDARLGQVFLNLIVNAAQAIPEGRFQDNEVRLRILVDGDHAVVEVADTGEGVPPGAEAHLFDAFFTTKPGIGTGLGLSICKQIVTSLSGTIEMQRLDRGTLFRVRVPRASQPSHEAQSAMEEHDLGRPRILLVDDEPQIIELLRDWLGAFDVRSAGSGTEALERLDRDGPFDVIVCDLMMGDLTGMDVHAHVQRERATLADRFVFTTGGAYTDRARQFLEELGASTLHKPFRRDDVMQAVRRVLAAH